MFKSSENLRLAAEMRALERVARPWREARASWFNGTPESIEARLAATERVLSYAKGGMTPAHMQLEREAAAARAELREASHRLLTDFLDDGARAFKGSKRVATDDEYPDGGSYGKLCSKDGCVSRCVSGSGWCKTHDPKNREGSRRVAGTSRNAPGGMNERQRNRDLDDIARSHFDKWYHGQPSDNFRGARGSDMLDMFHDHTREHGDYDTLFGDDAQRDALHDHLVRRFGSLRVAERGYRECVNCGGSLSGEEDDDDEAECGTCGKSAHNKEGYRVGYHEAADLTYVRPEDFRGRGNGNQYDQEGRHQEVSSNTGGWDYGTTRDNGLATSYGGNPLNSRGRVMENIDGDGHHHVLDEQNTPYSGRHRAEAGLYTAAVEDEACEDCGAECGEDCRPWCCGKAKHDEEKD